MTKRMRLLWLLLVWAVIAASAGCRHKPAYSDIDSNRTSRSQNQNSEVQAEAAPSTGAESPAEAPSQAAPAPPQAQSFKDPRFMDHVKGDIKDLPNYPSAQRLNVQIGPNQGVNMMTLVLQTSDPMDKIAAFYEQVIKNNHWTVVDKTIDPEQSEWLLKKDEENSARIQVKKEVTTCRLCPKDRKNIFIVRGEKLEETKK
jgi:hypothetical protein